MAKNIVHKHGDQLELAVSAVNGSGVGDLVMSGDPGCVGDLPFVALTDEDSAGNATCKLNGTAKLAVRGHDGAANAAIAAGDIVYWDNAAGEIDVATSGTRFGYALQPVASGATTTIVVKIGY